MKKTYLIICIIIGVLFQSLIISVVTSYFIGKVYTPIPTMLEVYTNEDIYYINGLNVTSEGTDMNLTFNSPLHLAQWFSERTSDDVQMSAILYENTYLVNDRDYPEDCFRVYNDYTPIGYFCPVNDSLNAYQFTFDN